MHSLAHLAIGVAGLATFRNPDAARIYALIAGVTYILLLVMGLFGGPVGPLDGLLPLNGLDNVLQPPDGVGSIRSVLLLGTPRSPEGRLSLGEQCLANA